MNKKDYMELEKEFKKGTKLLIVIFILIVVGALVIKYHNGI